MTNIFDVARKAGVSKSTVSRVFSHGYVADATRRKVILAANELNYVPSLLARQLRDQKTKTIGFIAKSYYPSVGVLLNFVTHFAERKGYNVTVYFTKSKKDEIRILDNFRLHALDGLFFVANRNDWSFIERYAKYGPIVTWRRIKSNKVYSSFIDHYPLYKEILEYIYNKYGVQKVGHILNDPTKNNTKARLKAINAIDQKYPNADNQWQLFYPEQEGAGEKAANKFLNNRDAPKIIVAYSDYVAAEFISNLHAQGLRVPNDIKVFGFDNSDFGKFMNISTIDTCLNLQVKNDVNYIISNLEQKDFYEEEIHPRLIKRSTC